MLDNLKIRTKLVLIYILCVLLPVIVTDSVVVLLLSQSMEKEQKNALQNIGERIEYEVQQSIKDAVSVSDFIYMNEDINKFLGKKYTSPADYYESFNKLLRDNEIRYYYTTQSAYNVLICTDNNTITNGRYFIKMSDIENAKWYADYRESGQAIGLCSYYEEDNNLQQYIGSSRHISIIRKMNYTEKSDELLKLDIDYISLTGKMKNESEEVDLYLCDEEKVVYSTSEHDSQGGDFLPLSEIKSKGVEVTRDISLPGGEWKIYITTSRYNFFESLGGRLYMIVFLLLVNLVLPSIVIILVNRSFRDRIALTEEHLNKVERGVFEEIICREGHDEIGRLIRSYNFMVIKIKELIEVVYRKNAEKQMAELYRKQAELNALQSQMNPHFMFNTLESIRMRSLIKKEFETADILEKFSALLRKAVQWDMDLITLDEEVRYVRDYLDIQKHRFGDRLEYSVYMDQKCRERKIPKFTLLTLVENACVHGIEQSIQGGRINIAVSRDEGHVYLEILDSGSGMEEEELQALRKKIEEASIENLQKSPGVGILNTVIRMQLYYDGKVEFEINSTHGKGTEIYVTLPLDYDPEFKND